MGVTALKRSSTVLLGVIELRISKKTALAVEYRCLSSWMLDKSRVLLTVVAFHFPGSLQARKVKRHCHFNRLWCLQSSTVASSLDYVFHSFHNHQFFTFLVLSDVWLHRACPTRRQSSTYFLYSTRLDNPYQIFHLI